MFYIFKIYIKRNIRPEKGQQAESARRFNLDLKKNKNKNRNNDLNSFFQNILLIQ